MTQAVELPGEANPMNLQNVLNAVIMAASSTQQQVQTGAQQLQNWEKHEKYYTYLQVLLLLLSSLHVHMLLLFVEGPTDDYRIYS